MNVIDYAIIIAIIAVLAVSFSISKIRKKNGKGCCSGNCSCCDRACK